MILNLRFWFIVFFMEHDTFKIKKKSLMEADSVKDFFLILKQKLAFIRYISIEDLTVSDNLPAQQQ